jgi:hypothetical protein
MLRSRAASANIAKTTRPSTRSYQHAVVAGPPSRRTVAITARRGELRKRANSGGREASDISSPRRDPGCHTDHLYICTIQTDRCAVKSSLDVCCAPRPDTNDLSPLTVADEVSRVEGSARSIVFQGATNALDPVMRVSDQIATAIRLHRPEATADEVRDRTEALFDYVGISPGRVRQYRARRDDAGADPRASRGLADGTWAVDDPDRTRSVGARGNVRPGSDHVRRSDCPRSARWPTCTNLPSIRGRFGLCCRARQPAGTPAAGIGPAPRGYEIGEEGPDVLV